MELSKNELRGITLVTQALSKKFRFIDGWQLNENAHKYDAVLFIDLIVDRQKFIEQYNIKEDQRSSELLKNFSAATLFSLVDFGKYWDTEEGRNLWEEKFDFFYEEKKTMERQLDSFYEMIPENLQKKGKYGTPVSIGIVNFISP